MAPTRRKSNSQRGIPKRILVRWDENLNELLLLSIQSVCNMNSIRIPWAKVSEVMGHNTTEGSIVQHLAKLRGRRIEANKPVPPPLRRGGVGAGRVTKPAATKPRPSRRTRSIIKQELDSDEGSESEVPMEDISSGSEYGSRTVKRSRSKKSKKPKALSSPVDEASDADTEGMGIEDDNSDQILVPGARFLEYPNDFEPPPRTPVANQNGSRRSKIVVLKYRNRPASHEIDPALTESPVGHRSSEQANWRPTSVYDNPYHGYTRQALSPMVTAGQGMFGTYTPATDPSHLVANPQEYSGDHFENTYAFNHFDDLMRANQYPDYPENIYSYDHDLGHGDMASGGLDPGDMIYQGCQNSQDETYGSFHIAEGIHE